MRLALNVLTATVIAFAYGFAGGAIASYLAPDPTDGWVVTREYAG